MAPVKKTDADISMKLDRMEKMQEQTLWLLKGSDALEIEGVIPSLKRIDKDLKELNDWRKDTENKKSWRTEQRKNILKAIGWFSGIAASVFAVFEVLRNIYP